MRDREGETEATWEAERERKLEINLQRNFVAYH